MDFSVVAPRSRTCVLKVYLHCPGCEKKVHKELQKLKGVRTIAIDREHGKVTVSGAIEPYTIQRALAKIGKRTEILWDSGGSMSLHPTNQNHCMQVSMSNQTHLDPEQFDQFSKIEGLQEVELTHKKTIKMTFNDNSYSSKFVADHDLHQQAAQHHHGGATYQSGCFDNHMSSSSSSSYYGGGSGRGHMAGCGCTLLPAGDGGSYREVGGGALPAPPPRLLPPPPIAYSRPSIFCDENPNSCTMM